MCKVRTILTAWIAMLAIAAVSYAQSTNAAVCRVGRGTGSGTLVAVSQQHGLVMSCYHVCGRVGNQFAVYFQNAPGLKDKPFNGRVVKSDRQLDLAAVLIWNPGIETVIMGDFQRHNGLYTACGYGGGYKCTRGPLVRFTSTMATIRGAIIPGDSGGALFDPYMRWCGVTNWRYPRGNNRNPRGEGLARSGQVLDDFVESAAQQCGVFTNRILPRRRNNDGGGYSDPNCPDGNCPNINNVGPQLPGTNQLGQYVPYAPEYQKIAPPGTTPSPQVQIQQQPAPQLQLQLQQQPGAVPVPTPQPQPGVQGQPQIQLQQQQPGPITVQTPPAATPPATDPRIDKMYAALVKISEKVGVEMEDEDEPKEDGDQILKNTPKSIRVDVIYQDKIESDEIMVREIIQRELGLDSAVK